MKTRQLLVAASAAATVALATSSASAASYTAFQQHDDFVFSDYAFSGELETKATLPLFDATLGELRGVRISMGYSFQVTANWAPGIGYDHFAEFFFNYAYAYTFPCCILSNDAMNTGYGRVDILVPSNSSPGSYVGPTYSSGPMSDTFGPEVGNLFPSLLGDPNEPSPLVYSGFNFILYEGECLTPAAAGCAQMNIDAHFVRDLKVDYIYKPAGSVPEPATWGLIFLGMGGVGYLLRRQQARPTGWRWMPHRPGGRPCRQN